MYTRNNALNTTVSYPLEHDFFNNSQEEIDKKQQDINQQCLRKINAAFENGVIDKDTAEKLTFYYKDGGNLYKNVMFLSIYKVFKEEENIQVIDPNTYDVLVDNANVKHINPNLHTVLTYRDGNQNPIYITLAGLKNVDRAIQKPRIHGKYYNEYVAEKIELFKQYFSPNEAQKIAIKKKRPSQRTMIFANEEEKQKAYEEDLAQILKPHDRLRDILRMSISVKRYNDIKDIEERLITSDAFEVDLRSIENNFCDNDVKNADKFSEKNFRNVVLYLKLKNGATVEVQIKLTALELVDRMTHPFYESLREYKEELPNITDEAKRKQTEQKISTLQYTIQAINRYGIEKHNQNEVLEKVMRMEEKFKLLGIAPQADGTYEECNRFLAHNFLARPKQALVKNEPLINIPDEVKRMYRLYHKKRGLQRIPRDYQLMFKMYDKSPQLKNLFKDASPEIKEIFTRYKKVLAPNYRCIIDGTRKFGLQQQSGATR